ncbi:Na+/H+ antiporter NhaA [Bremerella cremea]|uniref:Na(+)/H(+) antiporter NhaA n=2 Tax=Pirellulales TaxID=2691354 RepID=A0A2S8FSD5_9BACT|nr:Na+/H+ antiporter NhaA [Blastopirellula marina]RCS47585.1 Na+/H+ antiporter NhaA [Bremerella cremea]
MWKTRGPIRRLISPLEGLISDAAWGGVLLMICTAVALYLANSSWQHDYHEILTTPIDIGLGNSHLKLDIHHFINDALMAIFFFVVGLEIKREVLVGELSHVSEAILPALAAFGGMIVPAAIFIAVNFHQPAEKGWGIPMATDIAFSLGILSLLGRRVPLSAKVFLTAFAIVDDIGASLVIAFFYTDTITWSALGIGAFFFTCLVLCNAFGVRRSSPYVFLSVLLWLCFLKSGIHPTIAGILAALTIPARPRLQSDEFLISTRMLLDRIEEKREEESNVLKNKEKHAMISDVETASKLTQTPLKRFENSLHHWITFFIMPVFALANAGITFDGGLVNRLTHTVTIGILLGLILGKQIGVTLFAWLAVKLGWAQLPRDVSWKMLYGLSWLGGVGFTMSLFITNLAYGRESVSLDDAKVGILLGSAIAGIGGSLIVWWTLPQEGMD